MVHKGLIICIQFEVIVVKQPAHKHIGKYLPHGHDLPVSINISNLYNCVMQLFFCLSRHQWEKYKPPYVFLSVQPS